MADAAATAPDHLFDLRWRRGARDLIGPLMTLRLLYEVLGEVVDAPGLY